MSDDAMHRTDEFEGRPELVKKRARAFILERIAAGILVTFMVASMALLVVNAIQGSQTRNALIDCTDPSGSCYKQGQKRTGAVIQDLIDANSLGDVATQRVVVLTEACAQQPEIKAEAVQTRRIELLSDCVNAQLKEDKEKE